MISHMMHLLRHCVIFINFFFDYGDTLKDGEEYLSLYLCVIPNANEIKTVDPWRERMLTRATVYLIRELE